MALWRRGQSYVFTSDAPLTTGLDTLLLSEEIRSIRPNEAQESH
jgi:hypothetical protein